VGVTDGQIRTEAGTPLVRDTTHGTGLADEPPGMVGVAAGTAGTGTAAGTAGTGTGDVPTGTGVADGTAGTGVADLTPVGLADGDAGTGAAVAPG
jgi:hypothetical protein